MRLEDIGFYTLSDYRVKNTSIKSPLWRCELILTDRCNFHCPYCRGLTKEQGGDILFEDAVKVLDYWISNGLKNVRFSGGEPTLYKGLVNLISICKRNHVEGIAISTNGSADLDYYWGLLETGVNDFSISLDSCCSLDALKMNGGISCWDKVIDNIKELSKVSYVTIGVVLTEENIGQLNRIIEYGYSLGVSDIRIITSAKWNRKMDNIEDIDEKILLKYPILNYRINNIKQDIPVRGLFKWDNDRCPLVLDDMAVVKNKHYPCIIYLREHGKPIGELGKNTRLERLEWFENHNCYEDDICRNNCLDVCADYNNKYLEFNKKG